MKNPKKYFEGFLSGVSRISRVWGRHSPTRFPQGQNERKANFGTSVESCSKTAADCPCRVFPYIERTEQGLRPAVGGLFSFRQYDAGTGLCCPLAAAFSLSAKDTFQRPPATRWTGIFQNFFCLSNPGNRILATGEAENFSFHPPHHRALKFAKRNGKFSLCFLLRTKIRNAKRRGKKISLSLTTTIRTGQNGRERSRTTKKTANLFQTYCFHWPRRWRLVFSFENSFHIGMINGELLRYVFKRKRFLLEYIPQNMQSLYLSQCSIYIVFQQ